MNDFYKIFLRLVYVDKSNSLDDIVEILQFTSRRSLIRKAYELKIKRNIDYWKESGYFISLSYPDHTNDTYEIAKIININYDSLRSLASKHNVHREIFKPYSINEYFWIQETDEKYYILGYLMADGNLYQRSQNSYRVAINVCDKDGPHLEKIKNLLVSNYELRKTTKFDKKYNKTYHGWSLMLMSEFLYKELQKYGFIDAKSGYEKIDNIPNEYLGSFIRGYFDGDGYVHRHKLGICSSSLNILKQINNILNIGVISSSIKNRNKELHRLTITHVTGFIKFYDFCYKKDCLNLERKSTKILDRIKKVILNKNNHSRIGFNEILDLYNKTQSVQ